MALEVTLSQERTIEVQPVQTAAITTLTVNRMIDVPGEKKVFVFLEELRQPVLLWEGDAYDAIGDWTNANVDARLKEIYDVA